MNELLARIIEAHGGMDRWKGYEKVEATIVSGGGFYSLKGTPQDSLIDSLGKITENTSLKIDTTELRKQGVAIKTRIENIIQSSKQEQEQTQTSVRNGVMYG